MSEDQRRSRTQDATAVAPHRVTVLGSFTLTPGTPAGPAAPGSIALGADARRLVAYLAVHPRAQRPAALAADLWPGLAGPAALRLLDDAVAAVDVPDLLVTDADGALALAGDVEVDLATAMRLLRTLPETPGSRDTDLAPLLADILPGSTAAWIVVERERFRQLRLHAVEERSARLTAAGRHAAAVALARLAVRSAPSRESARRAAINAMLAQGDVAGAMAEYDEYQELLRSSVGAAPAFALDSLLPPAPVWPVARARSVMPRSAVQLPVLRSVRGVGGGARRLVAGGSSRH
jgi:DNA-binding SARP family transcriptional activator